MDSSKQTVVLKAGRLIDGTGADPKEDVAVVVSGNRITEIRSGHEIESPQRAAVIELGDATLMPGMIDAHMHFFGTPSQQLVPALAMEYRGSGLLVSDDPAYRALRAAREAREMLQAGITAARCLGSPIGPALMRAIEDGQIPGPRVVAAGEFICSTHGTWDHISFPLDWVRAQGMLADGADAMREIVRRRIREGAKVIKVGLSKGNIGDRYHSWGDDPTDQTASYAMDEVLALTSEAHLNKVKVSAHAIGDEAVRQALDAGVDVIEHGYGITDETREMVIMRGGLVVTTFSQLYFHELAADEYHYPAWQRAIYERHRDVMRADFEKGLQAGVRYALGTDLTGNPTHAQKLAAKEFELAVEWGMRPMEAIIAGTKVSAEALGMEDAIGTVEVGKLADIVGVTEDPLNKITALQSPSFVMQDGEIVGKP
jgi:imidazolonepropionase-like amidohydrolase